MAANYLGQELPDRHFMVDHLPEEGGQIPLKFYSDGKPYICWCDFWEMADKKFGLHDMHDILGHFPRQRVEDHLFLMRGDRAWRSIPIELWRRTKPADMGPLSREFNDALREYQNSEKYKALIPPYRNLWHLILEKVWNHGRDFTRDSFNFWSNDYFDLKKWPSWAWAYIMFLDNMTQGHPARDQNGVRFFIYW